MALSGESRKGQVWVGDLTISIVLFTAAAVLAFAIVMNSFSLGNDYSRLKADASRVGEYLLSEGTPPDWNESTVIRPGVLTGSRLNDSKLALAMAFSNSSYQSAKSRFQTNYDFMVVFQEANDTILPFGGLCSLGKPDTGIDYALNGSISCLSINLTGVSYQNLVRINRFVVYDSRIVKATVYMWN